MVPTGFNLIVFRNERTFPVRVPLTPRRLAEFENSCFSCYRDHRKDLDIAAKQLRKCQA